MKISDIYHKCQAVSLQILYIFHKAVNNCASNTIAQKYREIGTILMSRKQ